MAKNSPSFYAVRKGRNPGIYSTWSECEAEVKGYAGAQYKKFSSQEEADAFINEQPDPPSAGKTHSGKKPVTPVGEDASKKYPMGVPVVSSSDVKHADAFVDGSYNANTKDCGYGVFIHDESCNKQQIIIGRFQQRDGGRNVEGEVAASLAALSALSAAGYDSVRVYHDYEGIGRWADHDWKANKSYTKNYASKVDALRASGMHIQFQHVDGHTGVEGNEYVDKLAKAACGVPITSSERDFIAQLRDVPGYPVDAIELRELPDLDTASDITDDYSY